jgi:hypothetical protein
MLACLFSRNWMTLLLCVLVLVIACVLTTPRDADASNYYRPYYTNSYYYPSSYYQYAPAYRPYYPPVYTSTYAPDYAYSASYCPPQNVGVLGAGGGGGDVRDQLLKELLLRQLLSQTGSGQGNPLQALQQPQQQQQQPATQLSAEEVAALRLLLQRFVREQQQAPPPRKE